MTHCVGSGEPNKSWQIDIDGLEAEEASKEEVLMDDEVESEEAISNRRDQSGDHADG